MDEKLCFVICIVGKAAKDLDTLRAMFKEYSDGGYGVLTESEIPTGTQVRLSLLVDVYNGLDLIEKIMLTTERNVHIQRP